MLAPFKHQAEVLDQSKDMASFAVFWEQGTGKTRLTLDSIRYQREQGNIDAALIIAPTDVHRAWIEDELPKWAPDFEGHFWTSSKATTIAHKQMVRRVFDDAPFPVMALGYDGFMTEKGKAFCRSFFKKRRVFMVLDEATAIKTPGAKRSMSLVNAGRWVPYRRILTGTPITTAPWNVWSMVKFLDPTFWPSKGIHTPAEFRSFFGVWEKGQFMKDGQLREYPKLVTYRNLGILHDWLDEISSRVLKTDVFDLPPKLYVKRYFEMTPEQRRVYRELEKESLTLLRNGELVTVQHKLTLLLRFQQITSNYLPTGKDGEMTILDPKRNPRLDALASAVEEIGHQAIIFARFNLDVDQILDLLKGKSVRYDGLVGSDGRARNKAAFLAGDPKAQFFVTKASVSGKGHTFVNAHSCLYYNNSFSLEDRLQSEDRLHRAGQTHAVNYTDLVCPGTVDVKIVSTLRNKLTLAAKIQGDDLKEWI